MLDNYSTFEFSFEENAYDVYTSGEGPPIVVMHEVPGITPTVSGFADRLVDAGFRVYLPNMFGQAGKPFSAQYSLKQIARACISREFRVLAANQASPITNMLRGLCRMISVQHNDASVGAIGMCLTGNFALALAVEPCMMAPVLSQPSLPFALGASRARGLHIDGKSLTQVQHRVKNEGLKILGLRFTHDVMCPKSRFDHLREELGDGFEAVEIDSSFGNPHKIPVTAHSVLSHDFVDRQGHPTYDALLTTINFFKQALAHGK